LQGLTLECKDECHLIPENVTRKQECASNKQASHKQPRDTAAENALLQLQALQNTLGGKAPLLDCSTVKASPARRVENKNLGNAGHLKMWPTGIVFFHFGVMKRRVFKKKATLASEIERNFNDISALRATFLGCLSRLHTGQHDNSCTRFGGTKVHFFATPFVVASCKTSTNSLLQQLKRNFEKLRMHCFEFQQ
jgi:hypothetical protein